MKMKDTRRLGLVEVEVDDAARSVVLSMCPPGAQAVTVTMDHEAAFGLVKGLLEGLAQVGWTYAVPMLMAERIDPAGEPFVTGLPDV